MMQINGATKSSIVIDENDFIVEIRNRQGNLLERADFYTSSTATAYVDYLRLAGYYMNCDYLIKAPNPIVRGRL